MLHLPVKHREILVQSLIRRLNLAPRTTTAILSLISSGSLLNDLVLVYFTIKRKVVIAAFVWTYASTLAAIWARLT